MIIVSTNYDVTAEVLDEYAAELHRQHLDSILAFVQKADSIRIEGVVLESKRIRFFCFFGHGHRTHPHPLLDQHEEPAITSNCAGALNRQHLVLYGACCYSIHGFRHLAQATVIGFSDKLWIPTRTYPAYIEGLKECLLAVPKALLAGKSAVEATELARAALKHYRKKLLRRVEDTVFAIYVLRNERALSGP